VTALGTDSLKLSKVATFVNILWPSTPPHAIIGILIGATTYARLKLCLDHFLMQFQNLDGTIGMEGL
jgi:hypothetical protein